MTSSVGKPPDNTAVILNCSSACKPMCNYLHVAKIIHRSAELSKLTHLHAARKVIYDVTYASVP